MSKTSAVPLELDPREELAVPPSASVKRLAAERLAAHRALRRRTAAGPELFAAPVPDPRTPPPPPQTRAARIAAAVSERYAQSQSYRAFLEAEAERATQQARAAAEVARRTAEAVAAAQQQLLSELENWAPQEEAVAAPVLVEAPASPALPPAAALTVRLHEGIGPRELSQSAMGVANAVPHATLDDDEREALDEEIAFRQAPVFEEVQPAVPIAANLIEFPRQLVAPRKVRPRLAEGPLREESAPAGTNGQQLRIFEVEADQISTIVETVASVPEWSSIRLGACSVTEPEAAPAYDVSYPPAVLAAPFGLRLMAAAVDGCLLLAGLLGSVTVAAYAAGQVPTGAAAAVSVGGTLAVLFLLYQLLFFTFAEATPGMRYARIGLCTLSDDNPTRPAMRRRLLAVLLAACPMGLGFVWAWFDEDGLGWHDRISRMYQRGY